MRDILAWAFGVEIVGLAVLPLLRSYFANRRDAALLARPVGLAVVAYLGWVLSLLLPRFGFDRFTLLLALVAVAIFSGILRRRSAPDSPARAPWLSWGDEERLAAILFWSATGIFALIRAAGPAILGAEKFMDLAFLNSLTRFRGMPPADPWMAGKTINYYYWGYLLAAAQAKLSGFPPLVRGVVPLVAYNLSVATFAGFSFCAAACLGFRLSRGSLAVGLTAAGGTVFAGNVTGAFDAWSAPLARDFDYWHASRVIADGQTINEFPFFTFFHADLHPHLLAFPYLIAAFALAHRWIESGSEEQPGLWRRALPVLLLALMAGTAAAASLWNEPAMAILLVLSGAFRGVQGRRLPRLAQGIVGGLIGAAAFVGSRLLFWAYFSSFHLVNKGIGHADLSSGWLELFGVWGTLFTVLTLALWPAPREDTESARRMRDFFLVSAASLALLVGFASGAPGLAIILFLGVLTGRAAWRALRSPQPEGDSSGLFAAFLVLLALGMIAGCEVIYFKDSYGHDLQRMNTIFKFYHQAWPLLAIGAAVFTGRAWKAGGRRRVAFRSIVALAAVISLLYPINAAVSRIRQRDAPFSLNAHGPLERRNAADAAAIDLLVKSAPAGSVLLEASGDPYTEFARISSHTGIPTVMGWANHEGLWRSDDKEVAERAARVRHVYSSGDMRRAWETIEKFGVTHVVVGDMERRSYPRAADVENFPFLEPMALGDTVVYRVVRPK